MLPEGFKVFDLPFPVFDIFRSGAAHAAGGIRGRPKKPEFCRCLVYSRIIQIRMVCVPVSTALEIASC
jgi:hypothetical protein